MAATTGSRLQSIDMLRGVAALAVVLLHVMHRKLHWGEPPDLRYWLMLPLDFGWLGVTLFIVLSGFCIHSNTLRESAKRPGGTVGVNWRAFWKRRFFRLYPPYITVVILSLITLKLLMLLPGWTQSLTERYTKNSLSLTTDFLTHAFMVHNLTEGYGMGLGNGPLWSLGMEEQLYAMYFIILWARSRWSVGLILAGVYTVTLGWHMVLAYVGTGTINLGVVKLGDWFLWPFGYWFAWVLGSVAAEAYHGKLTLPAWCYRRSAAALLLALFVAEHPYVWKPLTGTESVPEHVAALLGLEGIAGTIFRGFLSVFVAPLSALACFVWLNACVRTEMQTGTSSRRAIHWLAWVGLFSYSLYLTHVPVITVCEKLSRLNFRMDLWAIALRYAIYVPVCVYVAWCFFRLVERRFLFHKPQPAAPPATVELRPEVNQAA